MVENCLLYTTFLPKELTFSHPALSVLTILTMIITMMMMVIIIIIIIITKEYVNVIAQNHYPQQKQIKSKILPNILWSFK